MQLDVNTDESFRSFLPGQGQPDDAALIPRFYVEKKLMGAKSTEKGRPVYEDREYIEIKIRGQDKQIVVEEVKETHKQRFPRAYAAFAAGKPMPVIGTPIEMLPGMGPSVAHHLKGINVRTVEDLAAINDETALQNIGMGARDMVKRAKAWIEGQAPKTIELAEQLQAEKDARAADRKEFEERLAALEQQKTPAKRRKKAKRAKPAPAEA